MNQFPKLLDWVSQSKNSQLTPEVLGEIQKTISNVSKILKQQSIPQNEWSRASYNYTLAAMLEGEVNRRDGLCDTTYAAAKYCSRMIESALSKNYFELPIDMSNQEGLLTRVFAHYIFTPINIFPHREAPILLRNLSHYYETFGQELDKPESEMFKILSDRIYEFGPAVRASYIRFRASMLLPPSERV